MLSAQKIINGKQTLEFNDHAREFKEVQKKLKRTYVFMSTCALN